MAARPSRIPPCGIEAARAHFLFVGFFFATTNALLTAGLATDLGLGFTATATRAAAVGRVRAATLVRGFGEGLASRAAILAGVFAVGLPMGLPAAVTGRKPPCAVVGI